MVKEGVRPVAFVIFRLWLVWLSLLSRAGAAEEREIQLAVEGLYGLTYIDAGTHSGGGGAVQLAYGLTDSLALQLTGVATGHPYAGPVTVDGRLLGGSTLATFAATAGIVYSLDVVRIVPFFEAGIGLGGAQVVGDAGTGSALVTFAATLGLGADYLVTRRWAVGLAVRYYAFLTDITRVPLYLTVGPRVTVRWGL